jgi:DNA polymerase-3 subunit gamma/tau
LKSETSASPTPQKEAEKPKFGSLKSTFSVPSNLQQAKEKLQKAQEEKQVQQQQIETNSQTLRKQPFTIEKVKEVFKVFAEDMKAKDASPFERVILENCPLELFGENEIRVYLSNSVQEGHLMSLKIKLLPFLREKLQNDVLFVTHEIRKVEQQTQKKLYTTQDKFNFLSDKFPILNELKDKFGFELER